MNKIIAAAITIAALSGCSNTAGDHNVCRNNVVKDVGTQNVVEIGPYEFVAKDEKGNVWYYETMNLTDSNVSRKNPVFVGN